jgi:T5orf172 domain
MSSAERPTFVYVVTARGSPMLRIGLAHDPGQRLRELQVGSPLPLELAHAHPCPDRQAAEAILAELERRFAGRRAHGHWYRLEAGAVRSALKHPAILAAPQQAAAARRLAAAEDAKREAARKRRRRRGSRARTAKELAHQRRRRRERRGKQRQAARLLARGRTQTEAAAAVAVTARTLRNWRQAPAFARTLARERERLAARTGSAPPAPRPRRRRQPEPERRDQPQPQPEPAARPRGPEQSDPAAASLARIEARRLDSYANLLDSNDARQGRLTPAEIRARERKQK